MSALVNAPHTLDKLELLRIMLLSRASDRREGILLRQSKGWFQVGGNGHEAIAALAWALREDDWVFPYYRDRALVMARGMDTWELALAYFAKKDSCSGGRQMPSHPNSNKHHIFSVGTPTGSNLLPAAGAAWGMRLRGQDSVVLATVGDAAMRQGEFYEAWAFAVQEELPLVIGIEDNRFGISTPTEKMLPFRMGAVISEDRLVRVDGRVVAEVYRSGSEAFRKARNGGGPTLMWLEVDRLSSHTSSDDHRVYRSAEEIQAMQQRDPILLLKQELVEAGLLDEALFQRMQEEAAQLVDELYSRADAAEDPDPSQLFDHTWGPEHPAPQPPIERGSMTMVEGINRTLRFALENDPEAILFGEDIEDPKGGVFGLTKGLSSAFPKQVFNSPLAEATIIGVGVGLAVTGFKPIFELQFIDFIGPAWNQVASNLSTLRWRTSGDMACPMVVYSPYGAYLPGGGIWHSQSNEGALAHLPGIRVVVPSTPEDAAGLLWSAVHCEDPVFVLVPKHVFRKRALVQAVEPVPFGQAKVVREGSDVTVVAWGNALEVVEEALAELEGQVSADLIDLRSLVPWDRQAVAASLEKTGRLVVVHEDLATGGIGQALVTEMVGDTEWFTYLLGPPQVVARPDVHVGYNPIWEYAALPSVADVVAAIRRAMS